MYAGSPSVTNTAGFFGVTCLPSFNSDLVSCLNFESATSWAIQLHNDKRGQVVFFEMVNGLSNMLQNKTKNPQIAVTEFYTNLINSLDATIKDKLDRLLAFVDNMNKLDQDKQEEQRQIGNLQERWNNTVSKLNDFDIGNMRNTNEAQQKATELINKINPLFNEAFEIHEEITKLGNDLSSHAGNQIKLILKA